MEQRSVLQSDYDRLQRERDNWKASAISAIERAEKAEDRIVELEAENVMLLKISNKFDDLPIDWSCECRCCQQRNSTVRNMMLNTQEIIENYAVDLARSKAEVERLKKEIEIACKHWRQKSNLLGAAMEALCDHVGIE